MANGLAGQASVHAQTALRLSSFILGGCVITLALATALGGFAPQELLNLSTEKLGIPYMILLTLLVFVALFSLMRARHICESYEHARPWIESALQAADGIATLALTFTLLGISLGIAKLAETDLNPTTVQTIIGGLSKEFGLAFMTTIVGLPVAAFLRAVVRVVDARLQSSTLLSKK